MQLSRDNSNTVLIFSFKVFSKHQTFNLYKASWEVDAIITLILLMRKPKLRVLTIICVRPHSQHVTELRFDPRMACLQALKAQAIKCLYLWVLLTGAQRGQRPLLSIFYQEDFSLIKRAIVMDLFAICFCSIQSFITFALKPSQRQETAVFLSGQNTRRVSDWS